MGSFQEGNLRVASSLTSGRRGIVSSVARSATAYLAKRALPNLTAAQERHLIEVVQGGDGRAKERLIRAMTPLVLSTSKTVHQKALKGVIDRDDLISEGFIGLERAIRNFDPTKKTRFYNYAKHDVRFAMLRFVASNMALVNKGRGSRELVRSFYTFAKVVTEAMDSEVIGKDTPGTEAMPYTVVDFKELSEIFGVSVDDLEAMHSIMLGDTVPLERSENTELLDAAGDIERASDRSKVMQIIRDFRAGRTPTQQMAIDHVILERDIDRLQKACEGTDISYKSALSCASTVRGLMTRHVRSKLGLNEMRLSDLNKR